ncbi:MAG: LysR family transcriptional regulator [Coxiellaceae bacterium]|nr:LysR family transcriptional regulator [Coxiellaceae bacterium]
MLPSSADLVYFLEVAKMANLTRAANRLGISQPSLSLAMQRLEKSIGTELLIRHQHGVKLTQGGKQLLIYARGLLQNWDNCKSQALASQHSVQGYYSLGCHATIAIHTVSEFLPQLLAEHPQLEIQLKHDNSQKIIEQVISLAIDFGIVTNPIKHPNLVIHPLCTDEFTFWQCSPGGKINKDIILADLSLPQSRSLLKAAKNKIPYKRVINMNSLEAISVLAAKGCGIGLLPARFAASVFSQKLKKLPKAPSYQDKICLVYRDENSQLYAFKYIIDTIKAVFH